MKLRYLIKVELELHTISCPGVWLCPSGYVEITIKSLGHFFKTNPMDPKFPILVHDRFTMEGYFKSISALDDLESALSSERIEITLWQTGRRLAYYKGSLGRVLQSFATHADCVHVVRYGNCLEQQIVTQLLMTPSRNFPGVLAPKIEISGRASVTAPSRFRSLRNRSLTEMLLTVKPIEEIKMPHEDRHNKVKPFRRQLPVCHANKLPLEQKGDFIQTDMKQLPIYDNQTPVCILASKIRYQSASDSTSRNSSNTSMSQSNFSRSLQPISETKSHSHQHENYVFSESGQEHSTACHICQSYKSIFSESNGKRS